MRGIWWKKDAQFSLSRKPSLGNICHGVVTRTGFQHDWAVKTMERGNSEKLKWHQPVNSEGIDRWLIIDLVLWERGSNEEFQVDLKYNKI